MSLFTHEQNFYAHAKAILIQEKDMSRLSLQRAQLGIEKQDARRTTATTAAYGEAGLVLAAHLFPGGVWLQLLNTGAKQLIRAAICKADSKKELAQHSFILSKGKNSLFWS